MKYIAKKIIEGAMTYAEYRALVSGLLAEGKTTGPNQSPALLEFGELNEQRMNRIEKTFRLDAEAGALLAQIDRPVVWLTLAEGWCGDVAQIVPTLNGLALVNNNILLRFILRDENLDVMDAFLTDEGRSIPTIIFTEPETGEVFGSWGPRPEAAQAIMRRFRDEFLALPTDDKAARKTKYREGQTAIHSWYAADKTVSTQREVLAAAVESQEE